jgi:carbamoyl-phosphate synthase large subunit
MLKANGEREISIHGVDMRADAIGRFLCDDFDLVPAGASPGYIPALAAVVETVRPDLLFVQSSHEIEIVARRRSVFEALGVKVLADGVDGIATAGDKALMHAACSQISVPQPKLLLPRSLEEFVAGARELGYPEVPVCFKPPVAKGSRGFRILSAEVDRVHELLHERPINRYMTLPEFEGLFRGVEPFPRLMLMEYVDAPEITVDLFADKGEVVFHQTRTREEFLTGLAMAFKTIARPDLVDLSRSVVRHLGLDYYQSVQWIGGKLLEINPRVSTFVYQEDFNIPYLGIKYALGELTKDDVAGVQARVRTSRRSVRYYDQVFWDA